MSGARVIAAFHSLKLLTSREGQQHIRIDESEARTQHIVYPVIAEYGIEQACQHQNCDLFWKAQSGPGLFRNPAEHTNSLIQSGSLRRRRKMVYPTKRWGYPLFIVREIMIRLHHADAEQHGLHENAR